MGGYKFIKKDSYALYQSSYGLSSYSIAVFLICIDAVNSHKDGF